jgi:hypothetical protein
LKPSTSQSQYEYPLKIIEPDKARSKNLIWAFFVTDDKTAPKSGVGPFLEKGATSQDPLEVSKRSIENLFDQTEEPPPNKRSRSGNVGAEPSVVSGVKT